MSYLIDNLKHIQRCYVLAESNNNAARASIQVDDAIAGAEALQNELKSIAKAIHYPDCWDTMAYPTLLDAVNAHGCNPQNCTKGES